jgi:hypothetical protein
MRSRRPPAAAAGRPRGAARLGRMRLSVRTQTGAAHVVEAADNDTVASVEVKLQRLTGGARGDVRLANAQQRD